MKRNSLLTRTIFFFITLILITFGTNITFGENIITGAKAQNIAHPRKVYVIWYYAANEDIRGDPFFLRSPSDTDFITPSSVKGHLQHVVEYFHRELREVEVDKTFEFYKSGNEIHVEYIQSKKFYVNYKDTDNAPVDSFLDTDAHFWKKAWQDIENNINNPNSTLKPFDDCQNIYLVLVQANYGYLGNLGAAGAAITNGGKAMVALGGFETNQDKNWQAWADEEVKSVIAHELGHIFGLKHDFNTNGIMSYDYEEGGGILNDLPLLGSTNLSERSKNWLSVHPDFSGNAPAIRPADNPLKMKVSGQPFTPNNSGLPPGNDITILIPNTSNGTPKYEVFVQMDDIDGLHHVELIAPMLSSAQHGPGYDPTGQKKHKSLATYLTQNGAVNMMRKEIDITQLVQDSLDRKENSFDLFFTAIDKQGNISYGDIDKHGNFYYTHSYTVVLQRPALEVAHPLVTEKTLAGTTVILELKPTEATYVMDISTIRDAVTVNGIEGVTIDTDKDVERISDNEIKVTLDFDGTDFDKNATLTFSVAADAITNYTGDELTVEIPVTARKETLSAITVSPLTEAILNESVVTFILTGAAFEEDISKITDAVSVSGIKGVSVNPTKTQRLSDRRITVALDFDGTDFYRDTPLTFSVDAGAITNYKGAALTVEVPVTASRDESQLKIFWAGSGTGKILRANFDGSNVEGIINPTRGPVDIALDVEGGKIYWILSCYYVGCKAKIQRANLDGSNIEDLVIYRNYGRPHGIALDVEGGKMYWTDEFLNTIYSANLDGSNIEHLVTHGLRDPRGIALDIADGKMYWTDDSTDKIQRANLDGSNIEDLVTRTQGLRGPKGIALDVEGGKMYWTTWRRFYDDKIQRANLDGSNIEDVVTQELGGSSGIAITVLSPVNPVIVKEDVNRDGVVDIFDLVSVALQFGKTGTNNADVNGDKVVNVDDFIAVAAALGTAAAAPTARAQVQSHFTAAQLQQFLTEARASRNTSHTYQKGIAVLKQLLALLTPKETALLPNFPNPFNPETWIPYQLAKPAEVKLTIYAMDGSIVRTLDLGHQPVGTYQSRKRAAYWDGKNAVGEAVASGVYFYTLQAGDYSATRKMLILK